MRQQTAKKRQRGAGVAENYDLLLSLGKVKYGVTLVLQDIQNFDRVAHSIPMM